MNWPGAQTIFELLLSVDDDVLAAHLKDALVRANAEQDTPWIEWMRDLIKAKQIEPLLDEPEFQAIFTSEMSPNLLRRTARLGRQFSLCRVFDIIYIMRDTAR